MNASVITPQEVRTWYERRDKPWPDEDHCSSLAKLLTKLTSKESGLYVDTLPAWVRDSMNSEMETGFDQNSWHVKSVTKAAKLLSKALPKIEAYWSKMLPTPGTLAGVEALKGLASALEGAIDYVEFPFGKYKANQAKHPKPWHLPSVLIAKEVIIGLKGAGRTEPGTAKGSIVAGVTCEALKHLKYYHEETTVAKHITGWFSKWERSSGDANSYWQAARSVEQWVNDCMGSRGRILRGRYMHRCPKFGPMDETCPEWPCGCASDILGGIPVP